MINLDFDSEINKKYFINSNRGEDMLEPSTQVRNDIDVSLFTSLDNLRDIIHQNAVNKGFWENPMTVRRAWLLIITELIESYEAYRSNKFASNFQGIQAWQFLSSKFLNAVDEPQNLVVFEKVLKDTFDDEIADVIIRVLDFCGFYKDYIGSIDEYVKELIKYDADEQLNDLNRIGIDGMWSDENDILGNIDDDIAELVHSALSMGKYEFDEDWVKGKEYWVHPINFLIVMLVFANEYDIDIHSHVLAKHLYNTTREYKHGKSF